MATITENRTENRVDTAAIISDAKYYTLEEFAERDTTYERFRQVFLDGLRTLEGPECAEKVAADGLGQVHRHFPIEKLHLLEAHLLKNLREDLFYWACQVGLKDLGLSHPFYIDHLIVIRIHYPFLVARKAKNVEKAPYPLGERLRLAMAALKNPRMLRNYLSRRTHKGQGAAGHELQYDAVAYHGDLPVPARAHGAHIDTWYGHSYDGVNLWWSIEGVNEDNTVIIYPEMFGRPVEYDPVSMYLAPGIALPRPVKVALKPGELLLFNPELLHGTQVNISDETRVALTVRINPHTPRFNADAPFNFEYWYASDDIARRRFSKVSVFPAKDYQGEPSFEPRPAWVAERTVTKTSDVSLSADAPVAVCDSDELGSDVKMALDLANAKVLLWRNGAGVYAYARACPHLGLDLADGHHEDGEIFCPGHGIGYSLKDGRSHCEAFRLRPYTVSEKDGKIYLQMAG